VGDEGEVREVALDRRVQDLLGTGVAEGRSVLVQQVHEFLENDPESEGNCLSVRSKKRC